MKNVYIVYSVHRANIGGLEGCVPMMEKAFTSRRKAEKYFEEQRELARENSWTGSDGEYNHISVYIQHMTID